MRARGAAGARAVGASVLESQRTGEKRKKVRPVRATGGRMGGSGGGRRGGGKLASVGGQFWWECTVGTWVGATVGRGGSWPDLHAGERGEGRAERGRLVERLRRARGDSVIP